MNKLTQINLYDPAQGNLKGFGALGLEIPAGSPIQIFAKFITSTIGIISLIAIIWFVYIFLMGAVSIITSGGDKNALESAKKKITSGLIGLMITIFAIFLVRFIGYIIGLPDILSIGGFFESLIIK
ncbi:hypothetical protein A2130_04470 [Candidatus Woesebacteria bacterium GWC2_33_12]|uniref:Uncharacterized protein n=1 Tax=Candidatus Woesebacteria bacterium GW2011_GWB1_33_22 TaxID=1618566 RepID=A0A0G0BYD1_9BACT|nr:MAG: hypothetical protein UR29_C0022G0003 [Candidatus Woesebacteria bacterium GW2011_GWC2_33_12]KKP41469.1 MAG: hypothetical protein UR33_C0015G0008 [Candidatus Woesebacteria bacterium GW2011_GWA2_33_20]KKP43885.1 MAG: hypothetical protein UR35_C0015G0008 [Candidatus Woesebacteria bacterium GW2011_GWB1_33_22]KKP45616.1 MAG: hypothetical protein UR37_C0017G0008 [Microgenomates group bacterium GW2011_GWC1_33_28]KKP49347.1 MAG: hypothetical protein UR41_C0016G0008 [Candidatus Woesebacteria bact